MELRRFKEEKLVSKGQNLPFLGRVATWHRYQTRVVPVPLDKTKMVPVPRQSGTGTTHQNRVGTGTNPSGINTTASSSPEFLYLCIVKLKFSHRGYRNPNK